MFGSKESKQEKKDQKVYEMIEQLGLDALSGSDREIMEDLLSHGCLVNNAKLASALTGSTTQIIANSLSVDILKTNMMLIRQNNEIINLLKQIAEK